MRDFVVGRWMLAVTVGGLCMSASGCSGPQAGVKRYGSVIEVRPEKIEEYKRLHANAWPGVLKMIRECNIRNYSIYLREVEKGKYYLFSYFEYTGTDFDADMKKMAVDETTQRWWKETDPCQRPIPLAKKGEHWSAMEEVFHAD
jgi:L-rhamnose mutarotase